MSKEKVDIVSGDEVDIVSGLSTGIPALDKITGIAGIPIGRITICTGDYSSGKTALTLQCLTEAQKQGYKCLFSDVERTFHRGQAAAIGVDLKKLLVLRATHGEKMLDDVEDFLFKTKKAFVVLDSYSMLSPRAEMESTNERAGMMEKSRMMAKFLRKVINYLPEKESILMIVAHDYLTVLPGGRQKNVMAGGDAMSKCPSVWWKLYARPLKEGEHRVGSTITIRQKKNKVGGSQDAECELQYYFTRGFQKDADPIEKGLADGSLTKEGNTYYKDGEKVGTISKVRATLQSNPS